MGQGGEIFILDMGEPGADSSTSHAISSPAVGLVVAPSMTSTIRFCGVRPGEKLYEELSCTDEKIVPTPHEKIHVWQLPRPDPGQVRWMIGLLGGVVYGTPEQARSALSRCVPEYRPNGDLSAAVPTVAIRAA